MMRPGKATRKKQIMGCSKRLDLCSLASRVTAIQQSAIPQSKILATLPSLEPPKMKYKNVQPGGGLSNCFDVIRFVLGNSCDVNLLRMASCKENVDPDIPLPYGGALLLWVILIFP